MTIAAGFPYLPLSNVVSRVTYITDDSIRCRPESLKRYMSICVKWLINGKQRAYYTFASLNGRFIDRRSL